MVPGLAVMADDGGHRGGDRDFRIRFDNDDRRFFRRGFDDDRRFFFRRGFDDDRFFFRNRPFNRFGDDDFRFRIRVDD